MEESHEPSQAIADTRQGLINGDEPATKEVMLSGHKMNLNAEGGSHLIAGDTVDRRVGSDAASISQNTVAKPVTEPVALTEGVAVAEPISVAGPVAITEPMVDTDTEIKSGHTQQALTTESSSAIEMGGSAAHDSVPQDQSTETAGEVVPTHDGHVTQLEQAVVQGDVAAPITGLEVRTDWDDNDSAISASDRFSTVSLRSSIYHYVEENGRRYHKYKEGKYLLPNDEGEQERLDLQHHLWLLTLDGKLNQAPLETIKEGIHNVLDFATGTGIWALDFAAEYPSANVIGTDLSPIQPDYIPSNCHFEVDDAEDEWVFSHKFDYVHGRTLASCFSSSIPVFRSAFNSLKSGGYFEMQDFSCPWPSVDGSSAGTAFEKWCDMMVEGMKRLGKDLTQAPRYSSFMREVGFVDIVEKHMAWPIGPWAKDHKMKQLGVWCKEDVSIGLQGLSMACFSRGLGMSAEEIEMFLVDVRKDINSRDMHCYIPIYIIYGRKP